MGAPLNPLDESHDSNIGLTEWDGFWVIREVFFDMEVYGGSVAANRRRMPWYSNTYSIHIPESLNLFNTLVYSEELCDTHY